MPPTPHAAGLRTDVIPVDDRPRPADLVTVVVPARDEARGIRACLDSVRAQTHRNLQIVVVDGGSRDGTVAIVSGLAAEDDRIELLHNPRHLITVSLNAALAAARGRWLVPVDHLREGTWGGVGGRKNGVGVTAAGRAIAAAMGSRFGVGGSTYHHGMSLQEVEHIPFGAYPVELARSIGGWDERLVANEDFEFDHRVRRSGRPLLFDPEIVIDWSSRQTVGDLFGQYRRYGRGKVDVAFLHPDSLRPRHVLPPAFVGYLALAALAARRRPARAASMLAPYAAAVAAASAVTGATLAAGERRWVAPAFVAMHVGWGLGFWSGLLRTGPGRLRAGLRGRR
jgi:hypothetical protein